MQISDAKFLLQPFEVLNPPVVTVDGLSLYGAFRGIGQPLNACLGAGIVLGIRYTI